MEINKKSKKQSTFICECGKIYKNSSGLWKHKKKCKYLEKDEEKQEETIYKELLLEIMNQIKQKDGLISAMTQMLEQQKSAMTQMVEQQKENNRILKKMTDNMSLIVNNNTNDDN